MLPPAENPLESRDAIEEHLGQYADALYRCRHGWRHSNGASPVVAEIARSKGILTVGGDSSGTFLGNEVLFRAIEGVGNSSDMWTVF